MANTVFNTIKLEKAVEWAFSGLGAIVHFLVNGSAAVNIQLSLHPMKIVINRGPVKVVYIRPLYFKRFFSNGLNVHMVQW